MAGSRKALQKPKWTAAELALLEDMLGNMPFDLLVTAWNLWAHNNGRPQRTAKAIAHKASDLGISRISFGAWIRTGDVARALGRWDTTIVAWARKGLIRRHALGHASAIHRGDLVQLAHQQPELFGGASRDGLMQLLEDPALVDSIRQRFPKRVLGPGATRRVRCIETGVMYPSMRAAAAAMHLSECAIGKSVKAGKPVAGWTFEALD